MIDELQEEVERAVHDACASMRVDSGTARQLTRAEISNEVYYALMKSFRRDQMPSPDEMRRVRPLTIRGVSFYVVDHLAEGWRIIAPALSTTGLSFEVIVAPETSLARVGEPG